MRPFQQAAEWHFASGCWLDFSELIEAHAQTGVVIITGEMFVLARRVFVDWEERKRCDPWQASQNGDCWHVWLAAGDLSGWEKYLPCPLPWISMHRRGVLRVHRLERFRRLKWRARTGAGDAARNGKQG